MKKLILLNTFLVMLGSFPAMAQISDVLDCTPEDWERGCFPDGQPIRSQEVPPETVSFDEGLILPNTISVKVRGEMRSSSVYPQENIIPGGDQAMRAEISRIVREANAELDKYKQERRNVIVKINSVRVYPHVYQQELRQQASTFFRKFHRPTKNGRRDDLVNNLGLTFERLQRSAFSTGPRLSSSEQSELLAQLEAGKIEIAKQGFDLTSAMSCMDDFDVCEETFVSKHVQTYGEGQKALELVKAIRGSDIIAAGSEQSRMPAEINDKAWGGLDHDDDYNNNRPSAPAGGSQQ